MARDGRTAGAIRGTGTGRGTAPRRAPAGRVPAVFGRTVFGRAGITGRGWPAVLTAQHPPVAGGWLAARPVLRGGRSVLVCLLLTAFIIAAVPLQHAGSPVTVSYQHDLATMTRAARYPVVAPAGLPLSWSPVSSAVALGGANGPGTATWHLGFATPSGTLASVEQSDAAAAAFIRRMTNSGTPAPAARIASLQWRASANAGRGQRS